MVIDDDAIVDQQLGGYRAHRRRGGNTEGGLHVRHHAGGGTAQALRLGLLRSRIGVGAISLIAHARRLGGVGHAGGLRGSFGSGFAQRGSNIIRCSRCRLLRRFRGLGGRGFRDRGWGVGAAGLGIGSGLCVARFGRIRCGFLGVIWRSWSVIARALARSVVFEKIPPRWIYGIFIAYEIVVHFIN